MAKTYGNILFEVRDSLGLRADQSAGMSHLGDAFKMFWDIHPWKETLGQMEPFYIVPGWSIYNPPFITKPDDFRDLYSAEIIEINNDGTLESRPIEVYGNMKPGSQYGEIMAFGYSAEFDAFLLDGIPHRTLGCEYILPIYKRDYPFDLSDADNTTKAFPFTRNEGFFKVVLGWHLRGKNMQERRSVDMALQDAKMAETPGKQSFAQAPEGLFRDMGGFG